MKFEKTVCHFLFCGCLQVLETSKLCHQRSSFICSGKGDDLQILFFLDWLDYTTLDRLSGIPYNSSMVKRFHFLLHILSRVFKLQNTTTAEVKQLLLDVSHQRSLITFFLHLSVLHRSNLRELIILSPALFVFQMF